MVLQEVYGWEVLLVGMVTVGGIWEGVVMEALLRGVMLIHRRMCHLRLMGISLEVMEMVWEVTEISLEVMEFSLKVREERRDAGEDVAGVGVEL